MIDDFKTALKIRAVEESFLDIFSKGLLNGTVHTCIGQELSAVAITKFLKKNDYVFSNHRCHGHYIAFTKNYRNLIDELLGKETGASGGIGGSQHLSYNNFFSNGPQGSLTPVAVGVANGLKRIAKENISVCFIGDGTMGEGILYESLNLASLYNLPVLFVCENNYYAQSTNISQNLAGSIYDRAKSFGLNVYESSTWKYDELLNCAEKAIAKVRNNQPSFLLINTYRLKAHSKGDDDRDIKEIKKYEKKDLLNIELKKNISLNEYYISKKNEISDYITSIYDSLEMSKEKYIGANNAIKEYKLIDHSIDIKIKQVDQINKFFDSLIEKNDNIILIGEDIKDPYGGAFKVTKGLSSKYNQNVISTPISEAAIVGMAIGLSITGYKPYVEIMFGDFISYAFDQILSNASKFYHMFNKQVNVPLVIRTPMGGGRGYGPTHSQSIEKFFNGMNNIQIIALNTFIDSKFLYNSINEHDHTTIVIENKLDYGRLSNKTADSVKYKYLKTDDKYPLIICDPKEIKSNLSIVTYGGSVHHVMESVDLLFYEFEIVPKIVILSKIYPVDIKKISEITRDSDYIITVEEGNVEGGFGSEIISSLLEVDKFNNKKFLRIGSENVPIPSTKSLENEILVSSKMIIEKIKKIL